MYSYTSNIYSIHQLILIPWNCINQGSHISVGDQSVWIQIWLLRRKGCDLCVLVTKYTPLHPHRVTMRIQTEMVNTKSSYRKDSVQWIPRPWNFVYILLTLNIEKCHLSNHPHICWGSCFLLWKRLQAGLSVVQIDHQCHLVAISNKVTGHKGSIRYKFDFVRTN